MLADRSPRVAFERRAGQALVVHEDRVDGYAALLERLAGTPGTSATAPRL